MNQPQQCAHPGCSCTVAPNGEFGKYCSEHCKEAKNMTELRCGCRHPGCSWYRRRLQDRTEILAAASRGSRCRRHALDSTRRSPLT